MIKESSLSADGRAWPNNPKVVNPEASGRDLTSGGAVHCCSRESKADGSSRRCDMTPEAYKESVAAKAPQARVE